MAAARSASSISTAAGSGVRGAWAARNLRRLYRSLAKISAALPAGSIFRRSLASRARGIRGAFGGPRMIRAVYSLLTILLAPVAFVAVMLRGLRDRAYWEHPAERFGWGRRMAAPALWLHAVSMGEVAAAAELVRALHVRHPDTPVVLTTSTPTGRARARALFGPDVDVRFLPYDTPGSVGRFLDRVRPRRGGHPGDRALAEPRALLRAGEGFPWCSRVRGSRRNPCRDTAGSAASSGTRVAASALIAAQTSEGCGALHRRRGRPCANARGRQREIRHAARRLGSGGGLRAAPRVPRAETGVDRRKHPCRRGRTGARRARAAPRSRFPTLLLLLVPRHPQRFDQRRRAVDAPRHSRSTGAAARCG